MRSNSKRDGLPSETARTKGRQDGGLDAFISYSHRDAGFVHHLKEGLEAGGHVVWIDADDIPVGAPWREELGSGIAAADAFVFVISPESAASDECANELARALELGKRLVPVLLREVEAIPSGLAATQYVDATSLDAASTAIQVGEAIDTDHEWVREHTQWLARVLRWQAHHRHKGYLLRGGELRAEDWLARQSERHKPAPTQLQTEFVVAGREGEKGRLRRLLIGALASVLVFAGLAVFALVQRNEAIAERDRAKSRELAAASFSQISVDPELSVLLGVEAMNVDDTPEARDALRRVLVDSRVRATLQAGGSVTDIAFDTAGDLVAATSDDGVVALVDAEAARAPHIGNTCGARPRSVVRTRWPRPADVGRRLAVSGYGASVLATNVPSCLATSAPSVRTATSLSPESMMEAPGSLTASRVPRCNAWTSTSR